MIPGSGPIGVMRDGRLAMNLRDHRGLVAVDVHVGEDRVGRKAVPHPVLVSRRPHDPTGRDRL